MSPQRCELCPHKDGALKRTDSGGKYHHVPAHSSRGHNRVRISTRVIPSLVISLIRCQSLLQSGWAHVVCALYIPEVQFANVLTMEPIILQYVPHERYNKVGMHAV